MSSNNRTTSSNDQSIGETTNVICRACLLPLQLVREIKAGLCTSCSNNKLERKLTLSRKNLNYSGFSNHKISIPRVDIYDLDLNSGKVLATIQICKNDFSEGLMNLKKIVKNYFESKFKFLHNFSLNFKSDLENLGRLLEADIHQKEIIGNSSNHKLLRRILKKKDLKTCNVFKERILVSDIIEKINSCAIKVNYKVSDFVFEPYLVYFDSSKKEFIQKFQVYINSCSNFRLCLDSTESSYTLYESGSYIEYEKEMVFYVGKDKFFSQGLWNINYSKYDAICSRICSSPSRENHSLEYFEFNLYIIGGNEKKVSKYSFESKKWTDFLDLPEKLDQTYSVRIGDNVMVAGEKSDMNFEINLKRGSFKAKQTLSGKKIIFNYDEKTFLINQDKIYVYHNNEVNSYQKNSYREFLQLRYPGKPKIVYPYLYFIGISESKANRFQIFRFCLFSYELIKLI